jgi:hypothetical protein
MKTQNTCAVRGCPGTRTKDSKHCLSCETRGFEALLRVIHAPTTPAPAHVRAAIEQAVGEV